jgi:hypothetical protein
MEPSSPVRNNELDQNSRGTPDNLPDRNPIAPAFPKMGDGVAPESALTRYVLQRQVTDYLSFAFISLLQPTMAIDLLDGERSGD